MNEEERDELFELEKSIFDREKLKPGQLNT